MHNHDKLLPVLFFLIWVLALVHIVAEYNYWYWIYRWFDIPMHFLGGVWLGLAGLWLWHSKERIRAVFKRDLSNIAVALGTGLIVGLIWEVYEFSVWHLTGGLPPNFYPDSVLDLVMDTAGALSAYLAYTSIQVARKKKSESI